MPPLVPIPSVRRRLVVLVGAVLLLLPPLWLGFAADTVVPAAPLPEAPKVQIPPSSPELPVSTHPCTLQLQGPTGAWVDSQPTRCRDDGRVVVLSAGDVGRPGPTLTASALAMRSDCEQAGCSATLLAGDLLYGPGTEAEGRWRAIWDEALAQIGVPGLAVLGNHEWGEDPEPEKKMAVLLAAHGRAGLVSPAPTWAARLQDGGRILIAFAGLDSDSLVTPSPEKPGLGLPVLEAACALGAPVIAVLQHPPSSQGLHHSHEAQANAALRRVLIEARVRGCPLVLAVAGHDHDLQLYPPGCEEAGAPAVLVSGVAARGFRTRLDQHLDPCPASGAPSFYLGGLGDRGGFGRVTVGPDGTLTVTLRLLDAEGRPTDAGESTFRGPPGG